MTSTATQQVALDNALVAPENRVQIGICNMRIDPIKTPKEPTYQFVLDALALTTCYPTFFITADILKIYICISFGSQSRRETHLPISSNLTRRADSSESKYESWGDSDDDDDNDDQQSDDERTKSDDDKSAELNKTNDEEEDNDVNIELKDSEREGKEKNNEEMTDAGCVKVEHENVNQEVAGDQVKDNAQAIVTAAPTTQKTKVPLQSSSISSDYATKFLNFDNIPLGDTKIISMMNVKVQHEDPSIQTLPLLTVPVTEFDQKRNLFKTMTKTKSFKPNSKHKALYHAFMESILEDEDAIDKGVVDKLKKRKPDDDDRDEGHPTRSNQRLKRKKTSKETKPSKKIKSTETFKGTTKFKPKSTSKSAQAEETISDLTQDVLVGPAYNILKGTCRSYVELEYNAEECYKALTDQLDWNNPEGDRYPLDLSKPLPLVQSRNCQIVLVDYFFNNDLAYLQGESTDRTYMTSLTKTKAGKYDLPGMEDMVPNLWSLIKVAYDKHALLVTNVKVNVWYGYGYIEEIEVRRSDQQLYKFMEGEFLRLYLNDIKDMLLLVVQNRLFNLKGEDIVHLVTALRMFTRRIVIQNKLKDL
uniref:Uncharacterized protein n=1 Tax=Tanacetum cinerariifolium TaxID=118510 RepID=A0A699GQ98_TANCI|nr:hypothetical protein [Tanacetum cinerariifolium]